MKTTEEYSNDYFNKLNELSSKGEQWQIRVTHEEFLSEIEKIRAYELNVRKSKHLNEYHIQRNVEGMISVLLMDNVTMEEAREQCESHRKANEESFTEEVPEIKLRLKLIQTPLNYRDTINIYKWLLRKQITVEMISENVFNEFAKTKHYEMIIREDEKNHKNKQYIMEQTDIELVVADYKSKPKSQPNHRFLSFDYCYNYFRTTRDLTQDIEKSCLVLGFYLASWGMLRNSFLLQKSIKHLEPTILYIAKLDKSVWGIDVDKYDEKNIKTIIEIYKGIKSCLIVENNSDLTLVTKVLLGVFGFIPAFDNFFCNSFREISGRQCGFRKVNVKSLSFIKKFYESNTTAIDKLSMETFTTDFLTGQETTINYPKAKIIDMYGFNAGQKESTTS